MSNEPIFQKLAREYAARGTSYERMTTPYLSPVRPLGAATQPLMATPVYGPNEHLDGPYKAPLPKRNLAQLIQLPEPDPEITKRFQDFISTAPLQILQGTPAGSFIRNMQPVRTEDGGITLEAEVAVPKGFMGATPILEIVDEAQRFQETGELDPITIDPQALISEEGWIAEPSDEQAASDMRPSSFEKESLSYFAGKHGDPDVVRAKRSYNPKQTDESVNAASNEENDEDDEPVILVPDFWKIRDEE